MYLKSGLLTNWYYLLSCLKNLRKRFLKIVYLAALLFLFSSLLRCGFEDQIDGEPKTLNCVAHKNLQLDLYLDLISYNCQEKIGILPYILKNPEGVYLEIGTGGDPIAQMLDKVPQSSNITLIASDIDEKILKLLPLRHPQLKKYLFNSNGPKLRLQKLNAVDMGDFEDNLFSGINASSVLHEIVSYCEGFTGLHKFFKEAFRVLKPDGVLVYRDPEYVLDKQSSVMVNLKNKSIRLFTHIFVYKFLDKKTSVVARNNKKFEPYNTDDVKFKIYKKNSSYALNLTYEQYLAIPSCEIDFNRKYSVTMPKGLYREIARHYITYLHQCNPLMFVKCIADVSSDKYNINYLAHSTCNIFANFTCQKKWQIQQNQINFLQKNELDQELDQNIEVLEFGIPLRFSCEVKKKTLRKLLKQYNFDPASYIMVLDNGDFLLDYRVFGMLYDEINQQVFDFCNGVIDKKTEEHAKWLKREGEEFYFYYSADELITTVLETTLAQAGEVKNNEEIYVLCPLSPRHNQFINRLCYTDLLNSSLEVYDRSGYAVDIKDGKRIIHFCKKNLKQALSICREIIQTSPLEYKNLQNAVAKIERQYTI